MMAVTKPSRDAEGGLQIGLAERPTQIARLGVVPAANAVTVVATAVYLICAVVAYVSIDLLIGFFQLWVHGLSLELLLRPATMGVRPDAFVAGLVTFVALVWSGTAAVAALYNALARR